jgi:hypothetical protein
MKTYQGFDALLLKITKQNHPNDQVPKMNDAFGRMKGEADPVQGEDEPN